MENNYFFPNQEGSDPQVHLPEYETYQENTQGVTGMGHPPSSQYTQAHPEITPDYEDCIQQDDGQFPSQSTKTKNQVPQYHNSSTQPNAYYAMNSGQPLIPPPNPYDIPGYISQVSPHQATSPVSMNRPTSPQAMYYAAHVGQVNYPMHHYQKPSLARAESCTPTSTISSAWNCTPSNTISSAWNGTPASTISRVGNCTPTSTLSRAFNCTPSNTISSAWNGTPASTISRVGNCTPTSTLSRAFNCTPSNTISSAWNGTPASTISRVGNCTPTSTLSRAFNCTPSNTIFSAWNGTPTSTISSACCYTTTSTISRAGSFATRSTISSAWNGTATSTISRAESFAPSSIISRALECTPTSTISNTLSCPPTNTISVTGNCTLTRTIPQASTGKVVSNVEDQSSMTELKEFAQKVKKQRESLRLTQENVGDGLGVLYKKSFSQTTISRFEAVQLTLTNMRKLKPMLERFYKEVETNTAIRKIVDRGGKPNNSVKRKKRTFIDEKTKQKLEENYKRFPHPSKVEIESISTEIELTCDVVNTWFCNRRQQEKKELNKCLKEEAVASGNCAQPISTPNTGTCAKPPVTVPQPCLIDMTGLNRTPYMAINDQNEQFIQHAMQSMHTGNYTQLTML
ncbi:POU domain, class 5, transcription factor -like [Pelobates cultripes]|uniref:POU domain, class 5, transcription factor -like n=1 Tax=Pelobates cultripes TaxID=61616 RepID=A0AAD1SI46_PELCU|nr:POU domain, class 5, transcription factor -like [Pelobates cultripes]